MFKNDRVFIVNVYCTLTEVQAFRVDVYSPKRGRVRIYAEANGPLSGYKRSDYFTFQAETEPPAKDNSALPTLTLAMPFEALHGYETQRYEAYLPACFGGERHGQKRAGCLGNLQAHSREWSARNQPFLEHANPDWYRLVSQMRSLSSRYGYEPR